MTPKKSSPRRPRPIAAYLRLSVATEESTSIAAQRALVTDEALRRGWPAPVIFVDEGVSGSRDVKRPGRDELERRIGEGDFSALIVKSVDRLARSTADFARIVAACKKTGTDLVVTDIGVDTSSPGGGMVLDVLAALASFEAAMIGARIRAGNEEKIRQGRALAGPVPYHLRTVPREGGGKVRVLDETKAPIAKEIVEAVLEGRSFRSVAVDLNARGVPAPRKGQAWTSGTVKQIVTNPAIAGMTRRYDDLIRGEDGLPVVDAATSIVDLPTWEKLGSLVGGRSTAFKPRKISEERQLLDGLAVCGSCGGRMQRSSTHGGKYGSYSCAKSVRGSCAARAAISETVLDDYVVAEYLEGIGDEEVVEVTRELDPKVAEERALIRAEVAAVTTKLASAGASEIADLAARLAELRRREDALRDEEPVAVARGTGETYRAKWKRSAHAERRELLADAITSVKVGKGRGTGRVKVIFGW